MNVIHPYKNICNCNSNSVREDKIRVTWIENIYKSANFETD